MKYVLAGYKNNGLFCPQNKTSSPNTTVRSVQN